MRSLGLKEQRLHIVLPRVFVIVTKTYSTLSAQPKLLLIQPNIVDDTLTLTAPSMPDFHLIISQLYKIEPTISHTDHPSGTVDCGSEVTVWLSQYINRNDDSVRLVFYPDTDSIRADRNKRLKLKETGFIVRFAQFKFDVATSCICKIFV